VNSPKPKAKETLLLTYHAFNSLQVIADFNLYFIMVMSHFEIEIPSEIQDNQYRDGESTNYERESKKSYAKQISQWTVKKEILPAIDAAPAVMWMWSPTSHVRILSDGKKRVAPILLPTCEHMT
jgi:hypothetical protein